MASAPFAIRVMAARRGRWRRTMGGYQVSGHGPGDDGYDEEGYDESQRAESLETTRTGPSDGTIMVDLDPDLSQDEHTHEGSGRTDGREQGGAVREQAGG